MHCCVFFQLCPNMDFFSSWLCRWPDIHCDDSTGIDWVAMTTWSRILNARLWDPGDCFTKALMQNLNLSVKL